MSDQLGAPYLNMGFPLTEVDLHIDRFSATVNSSPFSLTVGKRLTSILTRDISSFNLDAFRQPWRPSYLRKCFLILRLSNQRRHAWKAPPPSTITSAAPQ
jgi:hypothetical protein